MRLLAGMKLRGRLTLSVSLLLLVAIVPLVTLGVSFSRRDLQKQIHATLQVEAEGLRDVVEGTLAEREASVQSWAEDSVMRGSLLFDTYAKSDAVLASLHRRHPSFAGLALFTPDGRAVSFSTPALRDAFAGHQREVLAAPWFQATREGHFDAHTLTQVDPFFGKRVLSLAVPVVSPITGERIGLLLAAYDWAQVGDVVSTVIQRAHARGQESFALEVLAADGTSLYDSRDAATARPTSPIREEAANDSHLHDVGDGWRFVATVDSAEAYAVVANSIQVASLMVVICLTLGALASSWLARGITRPIATLSDVVGRIVREGDLTQKVEFHSRQDEVGELATAFSRLLAHLRESTTSLQQGTRVLGETVEALTSAAAQQERTLAQQSAAIQETQVTAQEIKQTSMMAAERSQAVLGVATRAREVGQSGESTVGESLQGFEQLREQVTRMASSIAQLNDRTQQIGGITQTVKDLADQSNMLALNAAIEAVRSGEHGKGFNVVAREIRSLADQSIQATGRVREILDDIRGGIHATVALSEEGQRRTETGLAQVRASGDSLRELAGIIQDNASAAHQIAAAVTQQNAGIAQIFTSVTDLSRVMEETMQGLRVTQQMTQQLRDVAGRMEAVARAWRV
ncbi:methyl-accepting chemotaxis protein [Myxococcaceae bacterium JPH2]|nr:methyl-accepting chemotaxis protein [Myxococcaceae bacterium JPH2]